MDESSAEKRGFAKGQIVATRAIVAFFSEMVKETFGEEAIASMLAENKRSHAEAESRGESVGVWDEQREREEITDRAAVFGAFLSKIVEAIGKGAHIDRDGRHVVRDKNGDEWVISKAV